MSWQPGATPEIAEPVSCDVVESVIVPRARDLGGFEVRRVLPAAQRRMVGPFIFLDQIGPVVFPAGQGLDVRPHPHIGLATVTYLLGGAIVHRDSLGSVQAITPGAVNWMTAGRGIVHSERSAAESRKAPGALSGFQLWVALPEPAEEVAPAFVHHPAAALPKLDGEGRTVRVLAGSLFGRTSPVEAFSDLFLADVSLAAGAALPLDPQHEERAAYLVQGTVEIAGEPFEAGRLLVFARGRDLTLAAPGAARLLLLGGEPMDGPRHVWWNFVSSRKERIEQAKEDWKNQRFGSVPGETERIPLPDTL